MSLGRSAKHAGKAGNAAVKFESWTRLHFPISKMSARDRHRENTVGYVISGSAKLENFLTARAHARLFRPSKTQSDVIGWAARFAFTWREPARRNYLRPQGDSHKEMLRE